MLRERKISLLTGSVYWNTVYLGTGLILLLGARAMRDGSFTVGDFALFVSYLGFVTEFSGFLGLFLTQYKQLGVSVARMLALMRVGATTVPAATLVVNTPLDLKDRPVVHATPEKAPVEKLRHLDAIGLTYHFGHAASDGAAGIENVSLTLRRGEFTVVTGRVGAGKTTLLRVLLGLLPRDAGEIRWNGEQVEDPATFFVPPRCAYVPQVPRLFSDSLKANILLGLGAVEAAVGTAVRAAVLEQDVAGLTHGLDTLVGSRGVRLSGGQVQRAAAARAFVRRAELLVVDDLSSALDVETERTLWERLLDGPESSDRSTMSSRALTRCADSGSTKRRRRRASPSDQRKLKSCGSRANCPDTRTRPITMTSVPPARFSTRIPRARARVARRVPPMPAAITKNGTPRPRA